MSQAITVKFLPCTNNKGARLKASCERGSLTIDYPHELEWGARYWCAAKALIRRFLREDKARYGAIDTENPWLGPWIEGETVKRETVFVNAKWSSALTVDIPA